MAIATMLIASNLALLVIVRAVAIGGAGPPGDDPARAAATLTALAVAFLYALGGLLAARPRAALPLFVLAGLVGVLGGRVTAFDTRWGALAAVPAALSAVAAWRARPADRRERATDQPRT
jgi:hypothetical protein